MRTESIDTVYSVCELIGVCGVLTDTSCFKMRTADLCSDEFVREMKIGMCQILCF